MTSQNNPTTTIATTEEGYPSWFATEAKSMHDDMVNMLEHVQRLGQRLVENINRDTRFRDYLIDTCAWPAKLVLDLERVGTNQLDVRIATHQVPFSKQLCRMPLNTQKMIIDGKMPLLTTDGSELLVRLDNITPEQAKQLFAYDHIRSLPEQRCWIESQRKTPTATVQPEVFVDKKRGELVVNQTRIPRAVLLDYLREMG